MGPNLCPFLLSPAVLGTRPLRLCPLPQLSPWPDRPLYFWLVIVDDALLEVGNTFSSCRSFSFSFSKH